MIVIPMAGLSSRFFNAGYTQPKYMLEAHNESLFDHAVNSFAALFETELFVFIIRDVYQTRQFVETRINALGIKQFHITVLNQETRGQAETVALGLTEINYQGPITIFNIDTFRPHFNYPDLTMLGDGYLEVFEGSGDNWSFAKPEKIGSTQVIETAEKRPISNLCCTGLYYFADINDFHYAYNNYISQPISEWEKGELYVAPLYNALISKGKKIHYHQIDREQVIFCGVPQEYLDFLNQ
ncbi:glycosyltransferase family 2 protein [Photobacterium carnosum]|uniref:glycosyltransferase family 2 protein n=1 Tax=Photobacterium carnosum TaxID=2023717 RepID=UPI001E55FA3D|nr:glycosyltransferase family 2 protein [Photobacterium carnosum]MCD9537588.1 capsular biosynthesis protein [Photobacterium carnosum]MCF2162126.1 capsular biosynthesis protein [Photobacterium carnosum]